MTQTTGESLPAAAIATAQLLVGAVHDEGAPEVAALLKPLGTHDLYALAVSLAAMVPADHSPGELLAWNDAKFLHAAYGRPVFDQPRRLGLAPCGTHAAFSRHRAHGEEPCEVCWVGERRYQRDKKRRSRYGLPPVLTSLMEETAS